MAFLSFYPFFIFLKESYNYTFVEKQVYIGKLVTAHYHQFSTYIDAFWKNYKYLFIGLGNSLLVSGLSTILTVYFSALTAYALTAYKWKLRKVCSAIIMFAMMIPSTISTYGFLQLIFQMRLTNKLFVYILPAMASPMTVFFMCMYLQASLSYEMIQSARIDGTSSWRMFWRITLPMISPMIVYLVITGFIGAFKAYSDAVAIFGINLNAAGMNTIVGYVYDMLYGDGGGYPSYASAAAIILFAIVLTITVINLIVSRKATDNT